MHYLTKKHISRRKLLRGAGVALALPLLESMLPAGLVRAAERSTPQSRLACLYIPHGAVQAAWIPSTVGRNFELSPTLQSLAPFRDQVSVVSNLDLPTAFEGDPSAGAHHRRSSECWLTCVAPGKGPSPTSMDQLAADHIGQQTALPSLELALEERASISYRTPTTPMPMQTNPRVVFERLFGDGSSPAQVAARRTQTATILDTVRQELSALHRTLPASDRIRMEQYLNDVREVERRLSLEADSAPRDLDLPERPAGVPDNFEEHAHTMFDLIALAWQADLTRVSTMLLAAELSNRVFPQSGVNEPFHNLSHHMEMESNITRLAQLNAYHVSSSMGYFLARLKATPDGAGTLLDHSLVLYGSGMGDSQNHNHSALPVLLAGGASGKMTGGLHLREASGTPIANLLVTLLDKIGVPVDTFADSNGTVAV
ncbi:MAG: hypothetical protein RLZZ227_174 [Pseudomonadota bacterium]|jgi:hypothetical protein